MELDRVPLEEDKMESNGFSDESFVSIEATDPVGQAIAQCTKWVIRPYCTWLRVIGWYDFNDNPSGGAKLARLFWVVFIALMITVALCTQIISCFRRDQFELVKVTLNGSREQVDSIQCNVSLVSIFVLPDILLLLTYFYGIYLFWKGHEYLQNLAEQVFVHCSKFKQWPEPIPQHLISAIFVYLICGVLYIVVSFVVRIYYAIVFDLLDTGVPVYWPNGGPLIDGGGKLALVIFSLIGFIFFDVVYIAAVMNHAIQSELNIYLLHALRIKVERKEFRTIDAAIKEINTASSYLTILNGKTATAVALILFNVASAGLNGIVTLADNRATSAQTIAATLAAVLWCLLVVFPFVQAARVTNACNRLLGVAHVIRGRPLQYQDAPQLELDSFAIFTNVITLRAEIFGVPIYPWMTYFAVVTFTFVMLVLCQNGSYWYTEWL